MEVTVELLDSTVVSLDSTNTELDPETTSPRPSVGVELVVSIISVEIP